MKRLMAGAAVFFVLGAAHALAQSANATLKEFGLFGTWANNCNNDPSPGNEHAIFSLTSQGAIQLRNDFGPNYDDMVYRIVDARRVGGHMLSLRQLLVSDDRIRLDVVLMKTNDRIRIWSSRGADGNIFVRDGAMPSANGQKTGWMSRCRGQWVDDSRAKPVALPQ